MSEQAQETTTDGASIEHALPATTENDSNNAAPNDQVAPPQGGKEAGYYPIDFENASPQEIKERYDYLFKQIKDNKRNERTLNEYRRLAAEQSDQIAQLTQGFNGVVNHLQTKNIAETETSLKQQMQTAWEKGDNNTYFQLQDKLDDLRLDKKLAAKTQSQPQQQQQVKNASQYAQQAQMSGDFTERDVSVASGWQDETDERGQLLRPWAFGTDPQHAIAIEEAKIVFSNPRFANFSTEKKLEEVDRRMGLAKRSVGQTVMGANLTIPGKTSKLTLTPKQQEIAIKTKYAGKGKSDTEHLDAYRKQISLVKQRRQS